MNLPIGCGFIGPSNSAPTWTNVPAAQSIPEFEGKNTLIIIWREPESMDNNNMVHMDILASLDFQIRIRRQ